MNPLFIKIFNSEHGTGKKLIELVLYGCMFAIFILIFLTPVKSPLTKIQESGTLKVITRNTPTTYYEGLDGKTGFEYDLVKQFADYLNVKLEIITPNSFSEIFPMLNGGQADLAAAGLTVTSPRKEIVNFGPTYQEITQLLIYKGKHITRPRTLKDIIGSNITVVAGSSFEERLNELKIEHPDLQWTASEEYDSDELLFLLSEEKIDFTIIDSNEFSLNKRFYPNLRVAFDISEPQKLAWAFPKDGNNDLQEAATHFFDNIKKNGTLTQLLERHYGHAREFNYVEATIFLQDVAEELPKYQTLFEEAATKYNLDWRLLAAMGYQESHWRTDAVSPTGVRGIMMLTKRTAGQLGVRNRLDARDSIMGGGEYLRILKDKMPKDIPEPDRTWMTVASYNVGFGHLEDARKLTKTRKGDPNKWIDVKKNLPLLSQRKWYKKTKYGYARGREPVVYVKNIRSYYDILVWLDERNQQEAAEQTPDPSKIFPQTL